MKISNRLQKLRQRFDEKKIDAILISQPENRYYLSGFDGSAGYLLITPQDTILATDFRYLEQAKIQAPDYKVFQIIDGIENWFPKLVAELNLKNLGFEAEHMTFAWYRQLTGILKEGQSKLRLVPVDGLVESLRAVKEPEEIQQNLNHNDSFHLLAGDTPGCVERRGYPEHDTDRDSTGCCCYPRGPSCGCYHNTDFWRQEDGKA